MAVYKAFVEMTFEPDENGYLEWEDEYGLSPEEMEENYFSKPRTEEEMKRFFADELYSYITLLDFKRHNINVEQVKEN